MIGDLDSITCLGLMKELLVLKNKAYEQKWSANM